MDKSQKSSLKKCSSCGANLVFDPIRQSLKCPQCDASKEIAIDKVFDKHSISQMPTKRFECKAIKCESCGALVKPNNLEFATRCPYCSSSLIVEMEDVPGVRPDAIIPFQFDKATASKKFVEGIKRKMFVPNKFKKQLPESEITGVYIPAFMFDADCFSKYSGRLRKTETYTVNKRVVTRTSSYSIKGTNTLKKRNLEVEASSQLTQKELDDIKPFDHTALMDYNSDYLRGYYVEYNDQTIQDCHSQARVIMKKAIQDDILKNYSYTSIDSLNISTEFKNEKYTYGILPTYRFSYKYGKKTYKTFMNGQTGKVGGNIPVSKIKVFFFTLLIIVIVALIVFLSAIE